MTAISRIHLRIFLAYSTVFLITVGGIFGAATVFINRILDEQIQQEAHAFKIRLAGIIELLRQDIREKIQLERSDPQLLRAIRRRALSSFPDMTKSALGVLEYADGEGLILASRDDAAFRQGTKDVAALADAQTPNAYGTVRLRGDEKRATLEMSLPIRAEGVFIGFVTGGHFLEVRLRQALNDQTLHPVFLKVGQRLTPLNDPAGTIPPVERESVLKVLGTDNGAFHEVDLIGIPHSVSRVPILEGASRSPAELIIAYSNRNEMAFHDALVWGLVATGAVGLIFVYIVSYVIGLRLTRPINQLALGATEIASGNLDHRVAVESRDEIGRLAGAFNEMASDLKASLERRIAAERVAAWRDVARRIAHEIKNPLFPIRLSVENLQRTYRSRPKVFEEIFDECTATVVEEVERLQRMVDEFHRFARMPAPERQPSDLNQIVRNVLSLYVEHGSQIQVEKALAPELPPVSADTGQIAQALGNLIKNAIEAMQDGGTLRVLTRPTGGNAVEIEIQDTGSGMSPQVLAEIFTPYYTMKDTGTGLGMSIVQRTVADHDGDISVESTEGVGTTVRIRLPIKKV